MASRSLAEEIEVWIEMVLWYCCRDPASPMLEFLEAKLPLLYLIGSAALALWGSKRWPLRPTLRDCQVLHDFTNLPPVSNQYTYDNYPEDGLKGLSLQDSLSSQPKDLATKPVPIGTVLSFLFSTSMTTSLVIHFWLKRRH